MVSDHFLALLVCPLGHAPLRREGDGDKSALVCTRCGLRFAIHDDIPNMIVEEAELPPGVASLDDLACAKAHA